MTKDILLKIEDGAGGFTTVAGVRMRHMSLNADVIDVTDPAALNRWRELIGGAKRASVGGSGFFKDAASDALVRQHFFDGTIRNWQVIVPDFGTLIAPFQVTALEYSGEHNGEIAYELALESAGALAFQAA